MCLRLQISQEQGTWLMTGLPTQAVVVFADLAECLDYAKRECNSAPAVIELFSDGMYVVSVPQALGWPQQICRTPRRRAATGLAGHLAPESKLLQMADRLQYCADRLRAWCARRAHSGPGADTPPRFCPPPPPAPIGHITVE